jgi:hypothetical protein
MTPAQLGALRGLLAAVIMAVVTWLANSANLNGIVAPAIGAIVSMIALSIEHSMAAGTSTALFGTVRTQRIQ